MKLPTKYNNLTSRQRQKVRELYVHFQHGRCWFCNEKLADDPPDKIKNAWIDWTLFPKGFLNATVHLQHDHTTGMTEGAVHAMCNAYMWQYEGK